MNSSSGNNPNAKLESLRKKEAALRASIAAERVRQLKRKEKDDARLSAIVGAALVSHGTASADFKVMLRQVLASAVTDEPSRQFLKNRGWL